MNPGIYPDLPNAAYLTESGWVSCSQLKRRLPEHFKPFAGSPSADLGSILHARFSGDETPIKIVDAATWQGKAAKEAYEQNSASGAYSMLTGDQDTVDGMFAALNAHSEAHRLLVEVAGAWEVSVFSEVDGVPSRCRFDRLLDDGTAVDLKTTKEPPSPKDLARAVINYGYDIQRAHYETVGEAAGIDIQRFMFVFVQSVAPHHVTVVELDDAFLERGHQLRDLALSRWLHPTMVDPYPGAREALILTMPRWAEL